MGKVHVLINRAGRFRLLASPGWRVVGWVRYWRVRDVGVDGSRRLVICASVLFGWRSRLHHEARQSINVVDRHTGSRKFAD
jgi:hypothetical protein